MILCPHCGNGSDSCECRLVTRRRFFAGFGLALGGTLLAPKLAINALREPGPAVVVQNLTSQQDIANILAQVYSKFRADAFPVLSPLLANVEKRTKPKSLFDPPDDAKRWSGNGVYWDVVTTQPVGPKMNVRIVRDYRCPRGSFAAFERFVENHYGQA